MIVTAGLFAAIAFKLLPSLNRIIMSLQSLRYVEPVLDLLEKEFKQNENDKFHTNNNDLIKLGKNITFKNVSFYYPGSNKKNIR